MADGSIALDFFAGFVRLVQYSSVWMFCSVAIKYYHLIKHIPQIRRAPYNRHIWPSTQLNFGLVVWNSIYLLFVILSFLIAIGRGQDSGDYNFYLDVSAATMDFLHALFMLVAARVTETYLPGGSGNGNCSEAFTWGVPPNTTSFFTLASVKATGRNATVSGAADVCYDYQAMWFIMRLMGYFALGTGSLTMVYTVCKVIKIFAVFFNRYFRAKWSYRRRHDPRPDVALTPVTQIKSPMVNLPITGNSHIMPVFRVPLIVNLIASHAHYSDMKSLLSTCKAGRAALDPESLREICCIPESKGVCQGCTGRVCRECQTIRSFEMISAHRDYCKPYCTRCYLKKQLRLDSDGFSSKYCSCKMSPRKENWVICHQCATQTEEEARTRRERREQARVRWPLQCGSCRVDLDGRNLCWWACKRCHDTCEWEGHPSHPPWLEV